MRYKMIALICAVAIIFFIATLLTSSAIGDSLEIKVMFIATCFIILFCTINKGANLDNAALLKSLNTDKFVWVTHRGASTVIDSKINNREFKPNGVFAHSKFQKLLGKSILELIDGMAPAIWVSLGRPSESRSIFLGKVKFWEWDKAISFQVAPSKISAPNSFFKKVFGKHQLVIKVNHTGFRGGLNS